MINRYVYLILLVIIASCCWCGTHSKTKIEDQDSKFSSFNEMVAIFKGFEEIVEKNKNNPKLGVEKCRSYNKENIPKLKTIDDEIGTLRKNSAYLSSIVETNREIQKITDNVTKIATDYYGIEGAEILMQLSDLVLARF